MQTQPFEDFARRVWRDALAREGELDSAHALAQQAVLERLLDRLRGFLRAAPPHLTLVRVDQPCDCHSPNEH